MSFIFDLDDNPISSFAMAIDSAGVATLQIRVECRTGYKLRCETVADLAVEAKRHVDSSYINLETTPIDLSAYDGSRQNFDVRLTASTVSVLTRENFKITVAP